MEDSDWVGVVCTSWDIMTSLMIMNMSHMMLPLQVRRHRSGRLLVPLCDIVSPTEVAMVSQYLTVVMWGPTWTQRSLG